MTRDAVFVSYSHADHAWLDRFSTFLQAIEDAGGDVWTDREIPTGAQWREEIDKALARTRIALLLLTQNFLASRFIKDNELAPFLEADAAGEVTLYAVAVEPSTYQRSPLRDVQFFNDPAKPLQALPPAEQSAELVRMALAIIDELDPEPAPD